MLLIALLVLMICWGANPAGAGNKENIPPSGPPATRVGAVVETIHGRQVEDPYRWLEDLESEETQTWIDDQNAYTESLLEDYESRAKIGKRLEELLTIGWHTAPAVRQDRYFYKKRLGLQNQAILYVRDGLGGEDRVLIDPNTLDAEGLVSLDWYYPTNDGSLMAYGLSREGTEQSTLYIMDVTTGETLPDEISRARHSSVSWKNDNSGFFYTRLPEPGSVPDGEETYHRHVYYHRLGRDPEQDPKVFGEGRDMTEWSSVVFSSDNTNLLLSTQIGYAESDVYFQPLATDPGLIHSENFTPVAVAKDALFDGEIVGSHLYLMTNYNAPRYRLLRVELSTPQEANWTELIPEGKSTLEDVEIVGDWIVAQYMEKACSRLKVFSLTGEYLRDIDLPTLGTVTGLNGQWDGGEVAFSFSSYFIPPTAYIYDLKKGGLSVFDRIEADIETALYEMKQVWYESKDGTRVSMFMAHKKGLQLDGDNPAFLSGYGGFNSAITPFFQRNTYLWLENGGVYAEANLRGGSEYGEEWHRAGMLGNKQNTFDDMVAAAEWLFANGYTRPERLVIEGGSNGGLLVGAVMTQRPDLCKAVLCWNPLLDMIRYPGFLLARYWTTEYGDPEDPTEFEWLYAYSPYHHVTDGTAYPATFLMTSDSDTRVHPMHALKMTARLQAATSSDAPIMLRFDRKSGHGWGTPLSKTIVEYTDRWTFVFRQLDLDY
jgi:prolyl oligopeptidase